jgi:hypothetical protein
MAFTNPLDPTTPTDLDWAYQGDDRIRELKAALIERLSQVIQGFPDTDPLKLKLSALDLNAPVLVDVIAARPTPPTGKGQLFYASDTKILSVSVGTGTYTWEDIAGTGSAVTQVGYTGLRKKTATGSGSFGIVGVGPVYDQTVTVVAIPAMHITDYIIIGARVRLKPSSEASYQASTNWQGYADVGSTDFAAGGVTQAWPGPFTMAGIVNGLALKENGGNLEVHMSIGIYQNGGTLPHTPLDWEAVVYLLALTDAAAVDA